jgi:hypothetical protein
MNNRRRGIPLARARIEQIFPKLTPTQIRRITPHGRTRATERGEVLYEQGDSTTPFFVVVSGELEVLRPLGAVETLVTIYPFVVTVMLFLVYECRSSQPYNITTLHLRFISPCLLLGIVRQ